MAVEGIRRTYEAMDLMPDEYRELLVRLLRIQADTETYLLFPKGWAQYAHIANLAPTLEDRVKVAQYLAEETRHGLIAYRLLRELGEDVTAQDFEGEHRNLYIFDRWLASWTEFALFNFLGDRAGRCQAEEWIECSYLPLARVAPAIVRDEVGHANMGLRNLERICRTLGGRAEVQALLPQWYAAALDMFGRSDSKRSARYVALGLKRRANEEARQAFAREVEPLIRQLGLEVPDVASLRRFP
jgi:ring-1,2-phenylacetyl-CoA epoxidase subunit PaaA